MPSAVKLSDELVEAARAESRVWSRSMTQQIEHWARIGRALERSGAISHQRIRSALTAELDFDALDEEERAVMLDDLERAISFPEGDPELAARLREDGPVSGLDEHGRVVSIDEHGNATPIEDPEAYRAARRAARDARHRR